MKKVLTGLLSISMSLMMTPVSVYAEDVPGEILETAVQETGEAPRAELEETAKAESASGPNVTYHSQDEIKAYIAENGPEFVWPAYDEQPDYKNAPYDPGKLTQAYLDDGLKAVNTVRYIAGLDPVTMKNEYNTAVQEGQLANAANNVMSHYPDQPPGMSDELYKRAYDANQNSNLCMGFSSIVTSVFDGWLNDGDSGNISVIGHRRWLLNAAMGQTGFGHVGNMTGMYSTDRSSTSDQTSCVWPAQNTPLELFRSEYPWSYSSGKSEIKSDITVTVTNLKTNVSEEFSEKSKNGYFNVDNDYYGVPGAVIWRPANPSYANGDSYKVSITGLSSGDVEYTVNFFRLYESNALHVNPESIELEVGESADLNAYFVPGFAVDQYRGVSYSGDAYTLEMNTSSSVTITAVEPGSGSVTFVSKNGLRATCNITVVEKKPKVQVYGQSISLEGEIGINVYLDIPDELSDGSVTTLFNGKTETIPVSSLPERTVGDSVLKYVTIKTNAKQMRDQAAVMFSDKDGKPVTLLNPNGEDVTDGYQCSVAGYCAGAGEIGDEPLKNLVSATDAYGKYAQINFEYKESEVTDLPDVSSVNADSVAAYGSSITGSVSGFSFIGMSLELKEMTSARMYFQLDGGCTPDQFEITAGNQVLTAKKASGSQYYVSIDNISAKDLDTKLTVQAKKGSSAVSIEFYPLTYVNKVLGSDTAADKLKNVCRALFLYNQAANAYFEK